MESLFPPPDLDDLFEFSKLHKAVLCLAAEDFENALQTMQGNVDVPDSRGRTPLSWAIRCEEHEFAKSLIAQGADCNLRDKRGCVPLFAAAWISEHSINVLLEGGADVNAQSPLFDGTALHRAAQSTGGIDPSLALVRALVKADSNIDACDHWGMTPLYYAIDQRNLDVAEYLNSCGSDTRLQDKSGCNGLSWATKRNMYSAVKLILEKNEDHTGQIDPNGTLMHLAAEYADSRTLHLLAHGGLARRDINSKNKKGLTPFQVGLQRQNVDAEWREAFADFLKSVDEDYPHSEPPQPFSNNIRRSQAPSASAVSRDINDSEEEFEDAVETQVQQD